MKKKYFLILIIISTLIFSCSEDESPVAPSAPIIASPIASLSFTGGDVTPATINLQNNSQNADSYLWEFGDGTTSTDSNPSKVYNTKGIYTIKLTASNTVTGKSNQTSRNIEITPGKVYLEKVIVDDIPFVDGYGSGWDLTTGPDVYFSMINSAGTIIVNSSFAYVSNVSKSKLPLSWTPRTKSEFPKPKWNEDYFIRVWDWDSSGDDLIGTTYGFTIDQQVNADYPTTVSLKNSNGEIKVRLVLSWE